MTHQELIERVCRGLAHRHMLSSGTSETLHWSLFEDQAREAIRITGEACAEANKKLVDSALIDIERAGHGCGEDRLADVMSGIQMSGQDILSLTQGEKP